jgi:hypothetical protein
MDRKGRSILFLEMQPVITTIAIAIGRKRETERGAKGREEEGQKSQFNCRRLGFFLFVLQVAMQKDALLVNKKS